jgi:hypothetical protein
VILKVGSGARCHLGIGLCRDDGGDVIQAWQFGLGSYFRLLSRPVGACTIAAGVAFVGTSI